MKKIIFFTFLVCTLLTSTLIFATSANPGNGYEFNLTYEGEVKKEIAKNATVTLTGTNATPYSNVLIKIELSGPATPEILAKDSEGNTYNLAQTGFWGPPTGFQVGGSFTNTTPITATYPEAGTYVTKLSLVDVNNSNAVITSKEFTITVTEDAVVDNNNTINNTVTNSTINNTTVNNTVSEIPQTGTSISTYIFVSVLLIGAALLIKKYKVYN